MAAREYDFYSPFMSAAIVTSDGVTYPLWVDTQLSGQPTVAGAKALAIKGLTTLAFVESITVHLMLGNIPTITVTLAPPFREATALLDSPLMEFGDKRLKVQFGYSSGTPKGPVLSPVFEGTLVKPPQVQFGVEASITLEAQGTAVNTMFHTQRAGVLSGTRLEVIEQLAAGPDGQRPLEVDASEVFEDGADAAAQTLLDDKKVTITPGWQTEWYIMQQLVREARCWCMVVNDTLFIYPVNTKLGREAKYRLSLFDFPGAVGPMAGVFPITSISVDNPMVFAPGSTRGVVSPGIASGTKERGAATENNVTTQPTRTTETSKGSSLAPSPTAPGPKDQDGVTATLVDPQNNPRGKEQAQAEVLNAAMGMGLQVEVETLGIPDLFPGDVVWISGVSTKRVDGKYGVWEITHTLGGSGYTSKLKCIANIARMLQATDDAQNPTNSTPEPKPEDATKVTMKAVDVPPEEPGFVGNLKRAGLPVG